MTGSLILPANGLQMGDGQIVTSGGRFGYGAAPNVIALFDIGGAFTAPTYTAHLLQVDGTAKSNGSYAQAYLRGINVAPTFDVSAGYANYLVGIETYMGNKVGGNVAHSVVGYHLSGQPTSGQECSVGFGISVPNQNTALCNGKYGFYQGDTAAQYNYFASKVGIGTPFPTEALTVQGNVQISGSLNAGSIAGVASQTLNLASGSGQPVNLTATQGTGSGGSVTIAAASAGTASGGSGGNLNLTAGSSMPQGGSGYTNLGSAGNVNITAGNGYNNVGGNVILTSGTNGPWTQTLNLFSKVSLQGGIINTGDGAVLDVEGGHNSRYGSPPQESSGGNIKLTAGSATGSYSGGSIVLQPGNGTPAGTVQVNGNLSTTGTLTLPANGLQMAGNQIVTSGGQVGVGAAPHAGMLLDIAGEVTVPAPTSWGAHLLQVGGTAKSNLYGQAYLKGIYVAPTFDVTAGYANYLTGIETYMGNKVGGNVAHSVVGYHLSQQPTSGLECNVGFGIGVPNQQTGLCNGKYGFYQGDAANVQYNYFASSVGIGTPFPSQALTVQGNAQVSGNITAGGSVGIGTTSPQATLDVAGYARLQKFSSPPVVCNAAHDSSIALTSQYQMCVCNGTAWVHTKDGTTACPW